MTWLLIVFGMAVVLSPLMWLKQSPHQKRITELRRQASGQSLQVSLHRRPDAREGEHRLESVCYRLPWQDTDCRQNWVLHRASQRGWSSDHEGWSWFVQEANPKWNPLLSEIVPIMPVGVSAIIASGQGIGVIWDERGELPEVKKICEILHRLRQEAEENCR